METEQLGGGDVTDVPGQPSPQQDAGGAQPGPAGATPYSGALSAELAHELANLMMIVSGSLEQLRRLPLSEQGQQQLARAEWGTRQAARLTRQVLSQVQGEDETPAAVDLNAVVAGFAAVMGEQVREGVRLSAELAPGQVLARLDAGLLELVLLNLVRNAADAMPDGGAVVLRTKRPRLDGLGDRLATEVSVSDTGTGMPPAVALRATDAFFTTKPPGKGTGLGLWMAQRFASTHDGKISIETAPGQGTTVRLALPYAGDARQA